MPSHPPCTPACKSARLHRPAHKHPRVSTNPVLSIDDLSVNKLGETVSASAPPHLPSHGQALTAHFQVLASRRGSPLAPLDGMFITTPRSCYSVGCDFHIYPISSSKNTRHTDFSRDVRTLVRDSRFAPSMHTPTGQWCRCW